MSILDKKIQKLETVIMKDGMLQCCECENDDVRNQNIILQEVTDASTVWYKGLCECGNTSSFRKNRYEAIDKWNEEQIDELLIKQDKEFN